MEPVFRTHTIICNWNRRGRIIVEALQAIGTRPIVIVDNRPQEAIREVGDLTNVFIIPGDPARQEVLLSADVPTAWSVIVLADESLGLSADARSVEIALAVERIQVSVHTVVELKDLRNKSHFRWTKVDELISDDAIGAKMFAQGIRHVLAPATSPSAKSSESVMLQVYHQLVSPAGNVPQVFRVNASFTALSGLRFGEIIAAGLKLGILPLALCGYRKHHIAARPNQEEWTSWKTDVRPNPDQSKTIRDLWPTWPGDDFLLGVIVLAKTRDEAAGLFAALK